MEQPIDRQWFISQIKAAGFSTQAEFAEAVGLSRPQWSNVLGGNRRLRLDESARISDALKVNIGDVLQKSGYMDFKQTYDGTFLSGVVYENGQVEAYPYGLYEPNSEKFNLPFHHPLGWNFLKVGTAQYDPIYREGDILAVILPFETSYRQAPEEIQKLVGIRSIIALSGHTLKLGLVYPGDSPATWTVVIAGPPELTPIVNTEILWVLDVQVIIPRERAVEPYLPNLAGVEFKVEKVNATGFRDRLKPKRSLNSNAKLRKS